MKSKIILVGLSSTLILAGCETIQSYFPDKEKDYRYTNEIPALVIPVELQNQARTTPPMPTQARTPVTKVVAPVAPIKTAPIPEKAGSPKVVTAPDNPTMVQAIPFGEAGASPSDPLVEKALINKNFASDVDDSAKPKVTEIVRIDEVGKGAQLRVNQNIERSWRIVGKALTRKIFEITERNDKGYYFIVLYDPDFQPLADNSIWDDVAFLFDANKMLEQEYKIALFDQQEQTYIKLLRKDNQACEDEKCVKLFQSLQEALQQSLKE